MSEKENIQLAEQAIAALNAHDIDRYLQRIDDSYVGESEMSPGPIRGHDGVRQNMNMLLTAFPDLHLDIEEMIATSDHVVTRVRVTATHRGNYAGVPATNKSVSWRGCTVSQVRNGKVIRSRVYADNVSLMQQLGVLSLPKAATAR
jgi:steroid delta-isomerase-like uncharacterized protein